MTDMEKAINAIQAVEQNAPSKAAARERLMEIVVEAQYRADRAGCSKSTPTHQHRGESDE